MLDRAAGRKLIKTCLNMGVSQSSCALHYALLIVNFYITNLEMFTWFNFRAMEYAQILQNTHVEKLHVI